MAFEKVTSNNLVGSMSPQNLSLALNGGGIHYPANASGRTTLGLIRCPIPGKQVKIFVTADAAYASGESLVVSLRYQNSAGVEVNLAVDTLDDTNITGAGTFESAFIVTGDLEVGNIVEVVHVYVPGGGAADPAISISIQFS